MLYDTFCDTIDRAYINGEKACVNGQSIYENPHISANCFGKCDGKIVSDVERECFKAWNYGYFGKQLPLT